MRIQDVETHVMSRVELLPTEIAQQFAAYLVCVNDYHSTSKGYLNKNESVGLIELRATSRTMQARVEHVFKSLFGIKFLYFHEDSLKRLVQVSQSDAYASLVEILLFIPFPDSLKSSSPACKNPHASDTWKLEETTEDRAVQELRSTNAVETNLLVVALWGLSNVKAITLQPEMHLPCSAEVRRHRLMKHAPTMILAAVLQSEASLESFEMAGRPGIPVGGLNPRVLNKFTLRGGIFSQLTVMNLKLTSRCCN